MKTADIGILMGLPGSGKSYWASHYSVSQKRTKVVDMDNHIDRKTNQYESAAKICNHYRLDHYVRDGWSLVFDGLFTTNKCVAEFIEQLINYFNNSVLRYSGGVILNVYIHYSSVCDYNY